MCRHVLRCGASGGMKPGGEEKMKRSYNGIDYFLLNPTGNITILVVSIVSPCDQPGVACMLMKHEPECEQVGFIYDTKGADTGLRMAGGEFCGNATMSAAAFFCYISGISAEHTVSVSVEVAGCDEPVLVDITKKKDAEGRFIYKGSVQMPEHNSLTQHELIYKERTYDLPVVDMGGILHIIATGPLDMSDGEAEEAIRKWCKDLGAGALGIMQVQPVSADTMDLRPLVYVRTPESCYWESSCASGTTAAGIYLAKKGAEVPVLHFREPAGELTVTEQEGRMVLGGTVEIVMMK